MNKPFRSSRKHVTGGAPMTAGEVMAIIGQIYVVVLLTLIVGVANVDMGGLIRAASILQVGDPATAISFTA